jgi:hypothetical protein
MPLLSQQKTQMTKLVSELSYTVPVLNAYNVLWLLVFYLSLNIFLVMIHIPACNFPSCAFYLLGYMVQKEGTLFLYLCRYGERLS